MKKKDDNWRIPQLPEAGHVLAFKRNLEFFISNISKSNKEIVFMLDVPDLDFDIKTCFDNRPWRITAVTLRDNCWMNAADLAKRTKWIDKTLLEMLHAYPKVKVYDPRHLFCRDGRCVARDGTLPYYTDGDHLNYYGAKLVVDDLMETILKR